MLFWNRTEKWIGRECSSAQTHLGKPGRICHRLVVGLGLIPARQDTHQFMECASRLHKTKRAGYAREAATKPRPCCAQSCPSHNLPNSGGGKRSGSFLSSEVQENHCVKVRIPPLIERPHSSTAWYPVQKNVFVHESFVFSPELERE